MSINRIAKNSSSLRFFFTFLLLLFLGPVSTVHYSESCKVFVSIQLLNSVAFWTVGEMFLDAHLFRKEG